MLSVTMLVIKYKADRADRDLTAFEQLSCYGALVSTLCFTYACATQGKVDVENMRPGQGGMSPLRPIGAMSRCVSMGCLVFNVCVA